VSFLRSGLRTILFRAAMLMSKRTFVEGFEIANLSESKADSELLRRVEDVLRLIAHAEPSFFRRMKQAVRRILIAPSGGAAGSYWSFLDGCALSAHHVLTDSTTSVAMTLIHEATHARLHQKGIRYTPQLQPRIEAICVRAEVDFARRIPGMEHLVAEAEDALSKPWWSDTARKSHKLNQLRVLGVPAWVVRAGNALFRR
jgi:hypothetical protein